MPASGGGSRQTETRARDPKTPSGDDRDQGGGVTNARRVLKGVTSSPICPCSPIDRVGSLYPGPFTHTSPWPSRPAEVVGEVNSLRCYESESLPAGIFHRPPRRTESAAGLPPARLLPAGRGRQGSHVSGIRTSSRDALSCLGRSRKVPHDASCSIMTPPRSSDPHGPPGEGPHKLTKLATPCEPIAFLAEVVRRLGLGQRPKSSSAQLTAGRTRRILALGGNVVGAWAGDPRRWPDGHEEHARELLRRQRKQCKRGFETGWRFPRPAAATPSQL